MVPSPIEWLWHWVMGWLVPGFTFNPWIGCEKVSAGCKNCYASVDTYARVSKSRGLPLWGPSSSRHKTSEAYWKGPLRLAKKARELSRMVGFEVRPRVFPSLCDPFEDRIDLLPWRAELFALVEATPELDWLLLTKRPENVLGMVPMHWREKLPANAWLGTSVENQETADKRIPELLKVPAKVRFLSCEPLLGEVDLPLHNCTIVPGQGGTVAEQIARTQIMPAIHWVIVGGESGPNARPVHPDWVRSIRDQCVAAGVPFFFKQWGEWAPSPEIGLPYHFEDGDHAFRIGKKTAGRLIDGRTWEEQPK